MSVLRSGDRVVRRSNPKIEGTVSAIFKPMIEYRPSDRGLKAVVVWDQMTDGWRRRSGTRSITSTLSLSALAKVGEEGPCVAERYIDTCSDCRRRIVIAPGEDQRCPACKDLRR